MFSFFRFNSKLPTLALFTLLLCGTTACSEYWWQRGQPPSVDTLLARSSANLQDAEGKYASQRPDVLSQFRELDSSLDKVVQFARTNSEQGEYSGQLELLSQQFMQLEGKLSIGSRAALGELSGQLRSFISDKKSNQHLTYGTVGMFAARTKNFLASELSVPAPVL